MYRRDYILRLIERFGQMLIALRDRVLRREADAAEVAAQLQQMATEAGVDIDVARSLDPASLLLWLAPFDDFDQPRLWLVAELLYLAGLQAGPAGADDLKRALALHSHLPEQWKPSDGFATAGERAAEIKRVLQSSE